jgi:hypothetical protein
MISRRQKRQSGVVSLSAAAAFYRTARVVAQVTGVPFNDIVMNAGPGTMRRPPVRFARAAALYLTVTAQNVRQMRLARALKRDRRFLVKYVQRIEDDRDIPAIDELLTRMEAML